MKQLVSRVYTWKHVCTYIRYTCIHLKFQQLHVQNVQRKATHQLNSHRNLFAQDSSKLNLLEWAGQQGKTMEKARSMKQGQQRQLRDTFYCTFMLVGSKVIHKNKLLNSTTFATLLSIHMSIVQSNLNIESFILDSSIILIIIDIYINLTCTNNYVIHVFIVVISKHPVFSFTLQLRT